MSIHTSINVDAFLENIMTSYESRIHKIQTAFQSSETITESSHNLFENVHQSLTDLKNNPTVLNEKLCETLAKNSSLRKKDYNLMMAGILDAVDEKEKEARLGVRVKSAKSSSVVATTITGRALEIAPGEYDIEVLSLPAQTKKGVKIAAGEETALEFSVSAPPQTTPSAKRK